MDGLRALTLIAAAFILYPCTFVITVTINVPVNDEIKAAGDPDRIADLGAVRARFNESSWTRWNLIRVLTSTTAFGCLAWALVVHGRST
jgi:uncharacterized membrane protein